MWEHYLPFMAKLHRLFAAMQLTLCSSCFRYRYPKLVDEHAVLIGRGHGGKHHHHAGSIHDVIDGPKPIERAVLDGWMANREHGLFHGLCTAIAGSLSCLNRFVTTESLVEQVVEPEPWQAKFFGSAILHDIARFDGGDWIGPVGHDGYLRNLFPNLLDATYEHAEPQGIHAESPVVIGDRLELRRYSDYADWVDSRFQRAVDKCHRPYVEIFYRHVRPALEMLYFHEQEIWIRHGIENRAVNIGYPDHDWSKGTFPQVGSFFNVRDRADEQGFSVEVGRGGLTQCMGHGAQWVHVQAIMPARKYTGLGGRIERCDTDHVPNKTYDHLACVGEMPIPEWLFHYREPLTDNPYADCLKPLFEQGALLIPASIASHWRYLVDQWRVRLELLRC